jgi:rhamnosyltransferase
MSRGTICAVVVTYHPDSGALANLVAVRPQVDQVLVVDNGSIEAELRPLREAVRALGGLLLENQDNLGIATALNRGVSAAREAGHAWVLLLDQDSAVTPGYIPAMRMAFDELNGDGRLAILVPRYVDRRSGQHLPAPANRQGTIEAATTSGSLQPVSLFDEAGYFAEDLFIDGVDYEYSLRVRALGFRIGETASATLLHSPGTPTFHRIPFTNRRVQAANYSPVRRFYQERNKILVTRRHGRRFLPFLLGQFAISAKDLVKIVLWEPQKGAKLAAFVRGWAAGLAGRSGRAK